MTLSTRRSLDYREGMTTTEVQIEQPGEQRGYSRARDLWVSTGVIAVAYWFLSTSSRSWCEGEDANGISMCTEWTLRPQPAVFVVLFVVAGVATTIMRRGAINPVRVARFALAAVWLVVVAAMVIAMASFLSVSIDDWEVGDIVRYPWWIRVDESTFPIGAGE